jgi:hypothetical protein
VRGLRSVPKVHMSTLVSLAGFGIFSLIMHVYFACNVILSVLTVVIVSNMMGSVSESTEVGPEDPPVNPGLLGGFSNIFINYACLLCLQWNIKCFHCCNCF